MESNRPTKFPTNPRLQVQIILAAVAILAGIGFWYFPWISDDINYRMPFRQFFVEGQSVPVSDLWNHFIHRHYTDNSRMATLAMIFIEFTPRIVQTLCSVAALWLSMWYGLKITGRRDSPAVASLWAFVVIVLLPWIDQMYVFDFQVAYLWGGAFALILSYMVLMHKGSTVGLILMSLLVGLWQEAFGFPLFVAFVCLWLFYREFRNRRTAVVIFCLLVGLTWLYLSPGGQSYRGSLWRPFSYRYGILIPFAVPSVVLIVLICIRYIRTRRIGAAPLFFLVSSIVSSCVLLYSLYGPRVGWWAALGGLCGIIQSVCRNYSFSPKKSWLKYSVAAVLLIFTVVHLCSVAYWSRFARESYDYIISSFKQNHDAYIYSKMRLREKAPWICLQKPYFGIFAHWNNICNLSEFYVTDGSFIKAVPVEFAEYHDEDGAPLSGNLGIKEFCGYLIGPYWGERPQKLFLDVEFSNGVILCEMSVTPFEDADGIKRSWFTFNTSTIHILLEPIPVGISKKKS